MLRSEAEVDRLVSENQKLVQLLVNRYLKKYFVGTMEREDLVSWGLIGLVQAARAWDPERGAFSTLACKVIEWMIVRGVRREWKPEQAAATVSLDEYISGEAGAGGAEGALWGPGPGRSGRDSGEQRGPSPGAGPQERFVDRITAAQDVEGELLKGETRAAVRSAVSELPARQRRLIERYYYEEVPIAGLAEELGVSRQMVYLRQRQALRQLRAVLSPAVTAGAP